MTKCHWCKGLFPDDQVSSVEQYTLDGKVQLIHFCCDSCLNVVFAPVKVHENDGEKKKRKRSKL